MSIMTLGYAALKEKIEIDGIATIDSTYNVAITKVELASTTGTAVEKSLPTYTKLSANFNVGLTNFTDKIVYNIEITNSGTVDVKLNNAVINITGEHIEVIKSGIKNGDILLHGETKILTLTISYKGQEQSSEITGTIGLNLDYTRLKGGTGEVAPEPEEQEHEVYAYHTTELSLYGTYTDLQLIMSNENRRLYQDGTELALVHPYYLKYTIKGDTITKRYVCFIADSTEHCLQGGDEGTSYDDNILVLQGVKDWFETNGGSCSLVSGKYTSYSCSGAGFDYIDTYSTGDVIADVSAGDCGINGFGDSRCDEE